MPELQRAIDKLLQNAAGNEWFLQQYWPENEARVKSMVSDVVQRFQKHARILDVGCGTGYVSFLFAHLGYAVTATDAWQLPERDRTFKESGVHFFYSNLNELDPFRELSNRYDVILMGEVIEHVLNWPLGLLRSVRRLADPGALLILTTPNPATVMNAWRLLRNQHSLWGTREFISCPKIDQSELLTRGDIHYREYTTAELKWMIEESGWSARAIRYMPIGSSAAQGSWKRLVKTLTPMRPLLNRRLFGTTQYIVAEGI